jgi:hypothetical protein
MLVEDGAPQEEDGVTLEGVWKKTKDKTNEMVNDCC